MSRSDVRLRAVVESDLDVLASFETPESDPWNQYEHQAVNALHRRFAENGGFTEDTGMLAVDAGGILIGLVSWATVQLGPTAACRALNIGISLFPDHRGKGYGSAAQRSLADYLFATKLVERIEASTDVDNIAEQRALEKAGFTREGVVRHAAFRHGAWRDAVLYSRLRGD